ncbi:PKD domain-containing protein [Streptacidiphilus carbonis]|uniref:PKD domain-containing protein n=1 Tax=Streptacidiphilus carbonis TaxID=105422 RepID=UPI0005A73764|nr:PKD domain-containing protein [Streptacidiphilus carbonis]
MSRSHAAGLVALTLLAAGVVLPTATASADATTLYVDVRNPACSDTAAGTGTAADPYCTIQAATVAAQPGGTVQIAAGGTYPATTITTSGTPGAPITIIGTNYISLPQLSFQGVHDVALRNLQLVMSAGSLQVKDSSDVTMDGLRVDVPVNTTAVEVSGQSSGVTVSRSFLNPVAGDAIRVDQGVQHTVISTDEISSGNNSGTGVVLDGAIDTDVTSNTFELVRQALTADGGSTGLSVENNVVYGGDIQVSADSAAQSTTGYNLFSPLSGADLYTWAGTRYTTVAQFQTATGQGRQDIVAGVARLGIGAPWPSEGYPGIDSADADAPGELATDIYGRPRVDDPLVPNTGTGSGYYDRGAVEFQDPLWHYAPTVTPLDTVVGYPVTVTSGDRNPWGTAVTRTFDFGDGTPLVTTTAPSVQHTYTTLTNSKSTIYTITEAEGGQSYTRWVTINPPGPLVDRISANEQNADAPLGVTVHADGSSSPFNLASCKLNFGDETPVVVQASNCEGGEHTYSKPGTYTISSTLTDIGGRTATASTKVTVGPAFVPVGPTRVLDTRAGLGAPKARLGAGGVVRLQVNGAAGVANASSVLLNLTVTDTTGNGFVTAYPDGGVRPTASGLNYRPGQTVANLVDVPVGANGIVDLYNSAGPLDVIADVEGYNTVTPSSNGTILMNDAKTWGEFRPVLDTRGNQGLPKLGKVGPGASVTFSTLQTKNLGSYEYGATAVLLDITETNATASSYVTAYEPGTSRPNTSDLNFVAGETRSTTVVAPVDAQGRVSLFNQSGSVDLLASVEGFYLPFGPTTDPVNAPMTPVTPVRVLDTRSGVGAHKAPMGPTSDLSFKVAGVDGIPAGATGVLVNLTAIDSTANGYLTAWGDLTSQPGGSALNFMHGQITPSLVYLPIAHGYAALYNPFGSVNVIADIEAYSTN